MYALIFHALLGAMLISSASWAFAQEPATADKPHVGGFHPGGPPCGPPPEAFKACEGKSAGSRSEFTNPDGLAIKGLCQNDGNGKVVLRPDRPPGLAGHRGPPPEAYAACAGKAAGAKTQATAPGGETIPGYCEQEVDRMVMRPDRSPQPTAESKDGK
jgi:hypothetical protein